MNKFVNNHQLASLLPADFVFGAATASYQIEGATHEDGRGTSIWDTFAATPGKVYRGHNGDVADDHYHRMPQDAELMSQLGLDAYRFSVAWPRILPQGRGDINQPGLDFYDRLVDTLLARGITPFATLYHWDLPQHLEDAGGWINRETAYAFADYAEIVARRLGDRVAGWITLNEPWCSAYLGYGNGMHAPGIQNRQAALDAAHHLLLAHGLAVPRIRSVIAPEKQVGITLNVYPVYAEDERPETARDVALLDAFANRWFLDPLFRGQYPETFFADMGLNPPPIQADDLTTISVPVDFLGINLYSRHLVRGSDQVPLADAVSTVRPVPEACYTDMAWEIYPAALKDMLVRLHKDYAIKALYVTENGAAFSDSWDGKSAVVSDPHRVAFLQEYITAAAEAVQSGVPLKGYFVWSLMDNYEWAEGYRKRFGVVYVDYETQQRIPKESVLWYSSLIKDHHALR